MSPLFARRKKRGLLSAAVAASAILALPAAAGATPAGNAPQAVTNNPDVVSSAIIPNPVLMSNVCYDTKVQMPSGATPIAGGGGSWGDAAHMSLFHLRGYASKPNGIAGALGHLGFGDLDLNFNIPIAAKIDNNNDHCVILQWLPDPTQHLDDWTETEADTGAVQDNSFRNSNAGSAALDGSGITQRPGQITSPNLVSWSSDSNTNRITYTFDRYLNPALTSSGLFAFYTADGTLITGVPGLAAVGGKSVVVQFPDASAGGGSVADAVRAGDLFGTASLVFGKAPAFSGLDTIGAPGGLTTNNPTLDKATPVAGLGGTYLLHYDKPVSLPLLNQPLSLVGVTENGLIAGPAIPILGLGSVGRPDANSILVKFPNINPLTDTKIVRIADLGFSVFTLGAALPSSLSVAPVRTTNQMKGFTEGPDLTKATLDKSLDTVTYSYDQPIAVNNNPITAGLPLFNPARTGILNPGNTIGTGVDFLPLVLQSSLGIGGLLGQPAPNQETILFGDGETDNAVGAQILGGVTNALFGSFGAVGDATPQALFPGGIFLSLPSTLDPAVNTSQATGFVSASSSNNTPAGGGSSSTPASTQSTSSSAPAAAVSSPAAATVQSTGARPVTTTNSVKKAKKAKKVKKAKKAKKAKKHKKAKKAKKSRRHR